MTLILVALLLAFIGIFLITLFVNLADRFSNLFLIAFFTFLTVLSSIFTGISFITLCYLIFQFLAA